MKKALIALFFCILILIGFIIDDANKNSVAVIKTDERIVTTIKNKISTFKVPARVEVRNYIQDTQHKYQREVVQIKKMKIKLDPASDVYLELNLFVNESDENAPLVAQFMLFDVKTQNLIQEENLNLE